VQAIGSLIGIGVAILVPYLLHRQARADAEIERRKACADAETERRLKARSLSLRVLPILLSLQPSVRRAACAAREGLFEEGAVGVEIPEALRRSTDALYLLGKDAGLPVQQLLGFLDEHAWQLDRLASDLKSGKIADETSVREGIGCRLWRIDQVLDSAIERVRRIHNEG
jgi:hypothetical protein